MDENKKTPGVVGKVLGWAAAVVFGIFALVLMPSLSSLLLLLAAFFCLPLAPIKELLSRAKISRKLSPVLAAALFLVALIASPGSPAEQPTASPDLHPAEVVQARSLPEEPEEPDSAAAEAAAGSAALALIEATPTAEPTSEPTPEPTSDPTPEPTPESTPEPTKDPAVHTYILNTNTHKFHYPSCSSVKDMEDHNKKEFEGTREEIIAMGYEPCGRCHP